MGRPPVDSRLPSESELTMPRTCTVCTHAERAAIEAALVAGTAFRTIADRFCVSKTALIRHRAEHIPASVAAAQEARLEAQALDVVKQLKAINGTALSILSDARKSGDNELALRAMDRVHRQIELQAKLLGEIDDRPQVNILVAPEWLAVRAALMQALVPFPDARAAAAAALVTVDGGMRDGRSA
jgi:hypothetical protein